MPKFSLNSKGRLSTCHPLLQDVFNEVIRHFDCTVLCGYRPEAEQNRAVEEGRSFTVFPDSRHNIVPSDAVDVIPYPVDWEDLDRFRYFGGFVMGMAAKMGTPIKWGGDWNRDTELKDNRFNDMPHFELVKSNKTGKINT